MSDSPPVQFVKRLFVSEGVANACGRIPWWRLSSIRIFFTL